MTKLRPYQSDVIRRVDDEIAAGCRRILIVAPTGAGKTVIAAAIIRAALQNEPEQRPDLEEEWIWR